MDEIWESIEGYEGRYIVSNTGNVMSIINDRKLLKGCLSVDGYYLVSLTNKKGKKSFYIHRLVAENFIENENNTLEVNHIDGNKTNNHVSNLQWVTHNENIKHSWDNGLNENYGENSHLSKITENDVRIIRALCKHKTQRSIASEFGISQAHVSDIYHNKTWNR